MKVIPTQFNGLLVIEPLVHGDARGYFMESYNKETFTKAGILIDFVQDNQSSSRRGVLRGLHFQSAPYAQTKLVRVLSGEILDVVVDLRRSEPTFSQSYAIEITAQSKRQLLVPKGFAHGFVVLSEQAEVFYKCDEFYRPQADQGINFADPSLGIDWRLPVDELIVSDKDKVLPMLKDSYIQF
jgi:dTDP-4-dehydrorhamnose 3,5-epimerase